MRFRFIHCLAGHFMPEKGRTFWVFPDGTPLQDHGRQPTRFAGLPQPSRQSQAAVRSGDTCTYQRTVPSEPGQLRQAADDRRAERDRPGCWAPTRWQADAPERHIRCQNSQTQGHDHRPAGDCKAICREGDSDHKFNIAPNLLDRDFTADGPNQKWAGDISYVWTR